MTSKTESDTRYWRITPPARVLALRSTRSSVGQWLRVWRWPAGLVAGLVLWLALVAVVGAATRVGNPAMRPTDCSDACSFDSSGSESNVITLNMIDPSMNADVISAIPLAKSHIDCRPGLPPRP